MQRQMWVQVIALAVGPKGGVEGFVVVVEAIARAKRVVESTAARMHCSIAAPLTSTGHEVVRLCLCKTNRAFIRWQIGASIRGSRGSFADSWHDGGKADMQELKWVSKVAIVEGEIIGDLRVFMS